MTRILFLAVVISLVASCASKRIYLPLQPISEPPLQQQITVNLGERMLMQAKGYYTDILRVGTIDAFGTYIRSGDFCRVPGSDIFVSFDRRAVGLKNAFGMIIDHDYKVEYDSEDQEICVDGTIDMCYDRSEGQFEVINNRLCSDPNSFQQVIEYNGRAGDVLQFTYREFSTNRIRAPFTTNFNMDLSQGDVIAYKGAPLKIIEATNQSITYMVLNNFNQAQI